MRKPAIRSLALGLGLAFLSLATILQALEWPTTPAKPAYLFGSSMAGSFSTGMGLASEGGLVTASDEGEVAFVQDRGGALQSRIPSTLGSYIAVEHARGLVGVYAQLAPGTASSYLTKVPRGAILGTAGASGWTGGQGLAFSLFDRAAQRWVNPLLLMPALADKAAPAIRSAALVLGGKSYPLGETKVLSQGKYAVAVDTSDLLEASWSGTASAPYFIRLVVDGAKVMELSFDVAGEREGLLSLASDKPRPYREAYLPDGKIVLATKLFAAGRSVIQVLVRDYAGNERQASWSISFE